jgi:diguanylate cyclase (GGDEF)-like protein/PAS domain S-box-containing protein
MARQLCLITCGSFDREILAIQSSPDLQGVRFKILPVKCDQIEARWEGLGEAVSACRKEGYDVGLAGGFCLTRLTKNPGLEGTFAFHQKSQCFEWIVDKGILDRFLQEGALLVLPGWLKDWEAHVDARWPANRKAAQAFFREPATKIVLLDTGVHPGIDRELKAFARFLRLPCEVHSAGLEYLGMSLARIVLAWRMDRQKEDTENHMAAVSQQIAGYARIGQLLGAVTDVKSVEEAWAGVLEIFRFLLSPRKIVHHSAESLAGRSDPEGSPLDRIIGLNADYAWADDRSTLFLKVAHDRELLGVLEMAGFGSPERRDRDLDLALTLARISGLALMNVKTSLALVEERDRATSAMATLAAGEEKMTRIFNYPLGLYRTTPQGQILDAAPTLARMLGYPDVEALKAVNFWDIHQDPADQDSWQAVLDSSSMVEIFETRLRRSNGTLFWARDSSRAAKDPLGNVLFYDGIIEDITRKKQMEEDHSWDVRVQASVGDVSEKLLSPTPIEVISSLVLEHARRLTSSATAFVGHIDEGTNKLVPAAMTSDARDMLGGHPGNEEHIHEKSGMWRWVLEKRIAILTNKTSLDPRFSGMPDWHLPVSQFLAVPAVMSGSIVGLIVVANSEDPYGERELKAIERLATLYAIAVHRTRTENELRELSLVDDLTKVYNRRAFLTLAEQQIKVAHRTKKEMTLFYVDLDDLKKINDSLGHKEGDAALVEMAGLLKDAFRDSDIIARMGGDEFVVLAIDLAGGKVGALARRLYEKAQARNARSDAGSPLSFSLGIARYDPDKPSSLQDLLALADREMYQNKTAKKAVPAGA